MNDSEQELLDSIRARILSYVSLNSAGPSTSEVIVDEDPDISLVTEGENQKDDQVCCPNKQKVLFIYTLDVIVKLNCFCL